MKNISLDLFYKSCSIWLVATDIQTQDFHYRPRNQALDLQQSFSLFNFPFPLFPLILSNSPSSYLPLFVCLCPLHPRHSISPPVSLIISLPLSTYLPLLKFLSLISFPIFFKHIFFLFIAHMKLLILQHLKPSCALRRLPADNVPL